MTTLETSATVRLVGIPRTKLKRVRYFYEELWTNLELSYHVKITSNFKTRHRKANVHWKWDISKLLHILKHEILSRERCDQFRGTPINESENNLEFSSTMYVNSASSFSCIYCNKPHAPNRCDVVTNVIATKNTLREKNRCYVCLKGGHNSNKCFSKYLCAIRDITCHGIG